MYARGPAIRELQERIWQSLFSKDQPVRSARPSEAAVVE